MKKAILALALALLILPFATGIALAVTYPDYQGYVNDFAGLLPADNRTQLETQLARLDKDTTVQIAVVTINSLEGNTVEEYAVALFEKWKIGQKGKDNGILLLVAKEDRKLRIEVGYGLEAIITDGRAGRIRDNDILPYFKKDDYTQGIVRGVNALESYVRDGNPPGTLEENPVKDTFEPFFPAIIIISVIGMYLMGFMSRSKNVWLGAIFGGIAGVVLGFIIGGIAAIIIMAIISGGFGAGLDFALSRAYQFNKKSGRDTTWNKTWGGFGGWGSGGGGGGGFGGFGGGSSGGGGASGGW
ncbi:MAG: hypothetical protein A2Z02_01275 [Chloroflexi bacterium RBG_16_48_7]|nr:MAG: hypothetical protein A2Z02_01275 [Chloroflexi bacterium RBG_16_48_7]